MKYTEVPDLSEVLKGDVSICETSSGNKRYLTLVCEDIFVGCNGDEIRVTTISKDKKNQLKKISWMTWQVARKANSR